MLSWYIVIKPGFHFRQTYSALPLVVPMPYNHEDDVEDIECHHGDAFPQKQFSVPKEDQAKACRNCKESDISYEALSLNLERSYQCHASSHDGCDEAGRTHELTNS